MKKKTIFFFIFILCLFIILVYVVGSNNYILNLIELSIINGVIPDFIISLLYNIRHLFIKNVDEVWDISEDNNLVYRYTTETKYQKIEFVKEKDKFALFINDEIQFHSNEYFTSHYVQFVMPILKYKPKKILILGGGDLLGASLIFNHCDVDEVRVIEIDGAMIDLVKNVPIIMDITKNVIYNSKLKIIVKDAISYVKNVDENFDMIINDIEINWTNQSKNSMNVNLLTECLKRSKIILYSTIDCDRKLKKLDYSFLKEYEQKRNEIVSNIKYKYYNGNKRKLLEKLKIVNKNEILNINELDFYITICNYPGIIIDDEKNKYGKEGYIILKSLR